MWKTQLEVCDLDHKYSVFLITFAIFLGPKIQMVLRCGDASVAIRKIPKTIFEYPYYYCWIYAMSSLLCYVLDLSALARTRHCRELFYATNK